MIYHITPGEPVCGTCKHYYQHYTSWPAYCDGWYPSNCGHCGRARVKHRSPGCEGCYHWTPKEG